jgi:hypothetical protein
MLSERASSRVLSGESGGAGGALRALYPGVEGYILKALCDYFVTPDSRDILRRAKARLDRLELYPAPVDLDGVRLVIAPWLFAVPGFRRFTGYATRHLVLLKGPGIDEDLLAHELCHVWQLQHGAIRVWLSYARPSTFSRDRSKYRANRYEREARHAVEATRVE